MGPGATVLATPGTLPPMGGPHWSAFGLHQQVHLPSQPCEIDLISQGPPTRHFMPRRESIKKRAVPLVEPPFEEAHTQWIPAQPLEPV